MKVEINKCRMIFGDKDIIFFIFINDTPIQIFETLELALSEAINILYSPKCAWLESYAKNAHTERLKTFKELYSFLENMGSPLDILFEKWKKQYGSKDLDDHTLRAIFNAMDITDILPNK